MVLLEGNKAIDQSTSASLTADSQFFVILYSLFETFLGIEVNQNIVCTICNYIYVFSNTHITIINRNRLYAYNFILQLFHDRQGQVHQLADMLVEF